MLLMKRTEMSRLIFAHGFGVRGNRSMTRLEANSAVKQRGYCCSVKCDRLTSIEMLSSQVQDHIIPSIGVERATDRDHVQLVDNLGI